MYGDLSLEMLSKHRLESGKRAPARSSLTARSSLEDWPGLRAKFRTQVDARARELALVDRVEMYGRYSRAGKKLFIKGLQALEQLSPQTLDDMGIYRMLKLSKELESFALHLQELDLDLESLSDEELEAVEQGQPLALNKAKKKRHV